MIAVEVHSKCGGELKAEKEAQHFVSPGYPSRYVAGQNCVWKIEARDEGFRVVLEFDEGFKLPASPNCTSDRLDVHDGISHALLW